VGVGGRRQVKYWQLAIRCLQEGFRRSEPAAAALLRRRLPPATLAPAAPAHLRRLGAACHRCLVAPLRLAGHGAADVAGADGGALQRGDSAQNEVSQGKATPAHCTQSLR
jgi:hypothetical protein